MTYKCHDHCPDGSHEFIEGMTQQIEGMKPIKSDEEIIQEGLDSLYSEKPQGWEERFDKRFTGLANLTNLTEARQVKSFIASELQQAERRGREAAVEYIASNTPIMMDSERGEYITRTKKLFDLLEAARQLPDNK